MGRNYTWHLLSLPLKDKLFFKENSLDSRTLRRSAISLWEISLRVTPKMIWKSYFQDSVRLRASSSFPLMTHRDHLAEPLSVSGSQIRQPQPVPISTIIKYQMGDCSTWLTMRSPKSATGKSMNKKIRLISTTREGYTHRACHLIWAFSRNQTSFSWFNRFSLSFRIKWNLKWDVVEVPAKDTPLILFKFNNQGKIR